MSASTQNQALAALLFLYREVLGIPIAVGEHAVRAAGIAKRVSCPPFVILSRRTSWGATTTSARCRSSSGTPTSGRR